VDKISERPSSHDFKRNIDVNDLIKRTKEANKKEYKKNVIIVAGSLSVLAVTGIIIAS
tara:strand:+ start:988 stop:1161 length:174 start_codon:yes stop_codon:yes gene_type:complete